MREMSTVASDSSKHVQYRVSELKFVQQVVVKWFTDSIKEAEGSLQPVLTRLCALYALTQVQSHIQYLVQGTVLTISVHVHTEPIYQSILLNKVHYKKFGWYRRVLVTKSDTSFVIPY